MDIEELNGNWNSLLGRATKMKQAGELDDVTYGKIWRASKNWRKWYKQSGPFDDMWATASTAKYVKRYRAALELAERHGVHPGQVLEMTAIEQASTAGDKLSTMIVIGVGLGAVTLLGLVLASTRGTGQSCD